MSKNELRRETCRVRKVQPNFIFALGIFLELEMAKSSLKRFVLVSEKREKTILCILENQYKKNPKHLLFAKKAI